MHIASLSQSLVSGTGRVWSLASESIGRFVKVRVGKGGGADEAFG